MPVAIGVARDVGSQTANQHHSKIVKAETKGDQGLHCCVHEETPI